MIRWTGRWMCAALLAAVAAQSASGQARLCNGEAHLCERPYDRVAYATTHNAMSHRDDNWVAPNQEHGITRQLEDGVRALMLDTHSWLGGAYLCHGPCVLGNQPLVEGLDEVRRFLETHPDEVVTLVFEAYLSAAETEAAFAESGLLQHVHAQAPGTPWPSLATLIDSGRRVVVFTDRDGGTRPWYHDVWQHAWETDYANETPEDLDCAPNRGDRDNALFILNHFLTRPTAAPWLADEVNHDPFLTERALLCLEQSGRLPNFVTVDFYTIGNVFDAVSTLNATSTVAVTD